MSEEAFPFQPPSRKIGGGGQTVIDVDASINLGVIHPEVLGANHRFPENGGGMWNPHTCTVNASFRALYRGAGLRSIRYPAGAMGNTFHWKRTIGPTAERIRVVNSAFLWPEAVSFGLDEAARFAEASGTTLNYMYNFGNGSARDAADLVEYLNAPDDGGHYWAAIRAANGHPEPYGIRFFEIGNEVYLPHQRYWMSGNSDLPYQSLYVHGGAVFFVDQDVGLIDDWREATERSDGTPNQVKYVRYPPVSPGSATVKIGGRAWERAESLASATGASMVYTLDERIGEIKFGDGVRGKIPARGEKITVSYRTKHDGFKAYYALMKEVDPGIKVYSCLFDDRTLEEFGAAHPYDGVVIHPYTKWAGRRSASTNQFHAHVMLKAAEVGRVLEELRDKIRKVSKNQDAEVVPSEYALFTTPHPTGASHYPMSLGQALHTSRIVMECMRLGLPLAQRHCLTPRRVRKGYGRLAWTEDLALFRRVDSAFLPTASARAFGVLSHACGFERVRVTIRNNPTRSIVSHAPLALAAVIGEIVGDKPAHPVCARRQMEALVAVASKGGGNVYLLVLNQNAGDGIAAAVHVSASVATDRATVWTLDAAKVSASNSVGCQEEVRVTTRALRLRGATFRYTFPACSLTGLKFAGKFARGTLVGKCKQGASGGVSSAADEPGKQTGPKVLRVGNHAP